ncbi:MAG: pyridoxine 5'-phosphate synthase [Rickettsiales bacterium]|nr:pyridoxine 5'-phosphate synthase [Pseudomonadota bacterium]MDA0966670.1 pyridoxine 5'-phosphate synthase [Pseudomonadota bacterium]MDG4543698.1 pyridoxine 5'-phosphate synthase [Rickettsiales bacterium]MDG4545845.1 pyridoxine 5'-phosphate synthase [Rickettsiales bacterium]MDG4547381.1 pyridoxine 5'-phosphate synthase [Rickettsiales bacterium]
MEQIRLGVNIDHIATIRNARGGIHPAPVSSLKIIEQAGANGITVHLREDRRHIKDDDVFKIKENTSLPLNLEIAATEEMRTIALEVRPNACCIVPEKREEITTEGGLDVASALNELKKFVAPLKDSGIRVSLFIDADERQILASKEVGADIVELHTGSYCNADQNNVEKELRRIQHGAKIAKEAGIECHAGHGLNYNNVQPIAKINNIVELNIGHFIIGESIFCGLEKSVKQMLYLMNDARK